MDENDDWEDCDLVIPNLEQQLKTNLERKLVEESDNELTNELFDKKKTIVVGNPEPKLDPTIKQKPDIKLKQKPDIKQKPEMKQEPIPKLEKKTNKKKELKRENEIFGEPIYDDEYAEYECKFYK